MCSWREAETEAQQTWSDILLELLGCLPLEKGKVVWSCAKSLGFGSSLAEKRSRVGPVAVKLLGFRTPCSHEIKWNSSFKWSTQKAQDRKQVKVALCGVKQPGDRGPGPPASPPWQQPLKGEGGLEHRLLSVLMVSDSRLRKGYQRSFWEELGPHFQRRRRESWQRAHQLSLLWNAGRAVVFAQKGFEKGTLHTNFLSFFFFFYVLSTFSLLPGHVVASEKPAVYKLIT